MAVFRLTSNTILGVLFVNMVIYHAEAELDFEKEILKEMFHIIKTEYEPSLLNDAMVNDAIAIVCQGYIESQREEQKDSLDPKEAWVHLEYEMEQCVHLLNKYADSLNVISNPQQHSVEERGKNHPFIESVLSNEKQLKRDFHVLLSVEETQNSAVVNDVIFKLCFIHIMESWKPWVWPEFGMQQCVQILGKLVDPFNDIGNRQRFSGGGGQWNQLNRLNNSLHLVKEALKEEL